MAKKQRYTVKQVIAALKKHRGLIGEAARELKCGRRTVYDYAERYPTIKEVVSDLREERLDYTESRLYDLIDKGEPSAIYFHLKTQGKSRGWVERQELTGADGETIQVRFVENIIGQPHSLPAGGPAPDPGGVHSVG